MRLGASVVTAVCAGKLGCFPGGLAGYMGELKTHSQKNKREKLYTNSKFVWRKWMGELTFQGFFGV